MKKGYILLICILCLLTVSAVNAQDNITNEISTSDDSPVELSTQDGEKLDKTYFYDVENDIRYADDTVETKNVVKYYGDKNTKFKIIVYDDDYNLESGVYVSFGKDWSSLVEKRTNSYGVVNFPINYKVGKHSVMTYIECEDSENYFLAHNTVTIKSTIPTKTIFKSVGDKNRKIEIKFLDTKGKALKNKVVKIKFNGKTYKAKTNSKGIAKIKIKKLNVGTYKLTAINPVSKEKRTVKLKIYKTKTASAKVVNIKDGELFKTKCRYLEKGDAIICFKEYRKNVQYCRGINIDHWYAGSDGEDIEPHHTQLLKAKVFYKNSKGKVITKTKKANKWGMIPCFEFVKGYNAYKVKVWYRNK